MELKDVDTLKGFALILLAGIIAAILLYVWSKAIQPHIPGLIATAPPAQPVAQAA